MSSTPRKCRFRIRHMLEAIERIRQYTSGKSEDQRQSGGMDVVVREVEEQRIKGEKEKRREGTRSAPVVL